MEPPSINDKVIASFCPDDEIKELGDRIVNLPLKEAVVLLKILQRKVSNET